MGLSRNKVAVSEGAAGSPPFYGDSAVDQKDVLRTEDQRVERSTAKNYVVQYSVNN